MGRIIEIYRTSLEELAEEGNELIKIVEEGYIKDLLEFTVDPEAWYKESLLRYQKLFDYLEKGYGFSTGSFKFSPSHEGMAQLDQLILFNKYFDELKFSFKFTEKPLAGYSVCPPDDAWKKLAAEFNREIILKARNSWEHISEINPEQKDILSLMKEFNLATAEIGKVNYRRYKDLAFDRRKQEWEYSSIRSPL